MLVAIIVIDAATALSGLFTSLRAPALCPARLVRHNTSMSMARSSQSTRLSSTSSPVVLSVLSSRTYRETHKSCKQQQEQTIKDMLGSSFLVSCLYLQPLHRPLQLASCVHDCLAHRPLIEHRQLHCHLWVVQRSVYTTRRADRGQAQCRRLLMHSIPMAGSQALKQQLMQ